MKATQLALSIVLGLGVSLAAHADYNVTVPTNNCTWSTTNSGTAAGSPGHVVTWKNESLSCPSLGTVATMSSWRSTDSQHGCSISGVSQYKINGNCNGYSIYYTVVEPKPALPQGAACTYSSQSNGSSGFGNTIVYFYPAVGPCANTRKVKEYHNGQYVRTSYS